MEIAGIEIEIVKKNIKNIHLSVLPPNGRVRVSAPLSFSDENIYQFVCTKISWIKEQQEKFQNQARQSKREFESGETLYVLGKQYFLQVEYSNKKNSLMLKGNKAILTVRKESTVKQRENFVNEWYRCLLKQEIEKYLPKWEQETNLFCKDWQTRNMKTRWGTCNQTKKKIYFNLQLIKKPIQCLEYVILHELIHLKIRNHGKEFVSLLNQYMSDWKERKRILNDSKLDYLE